MDISESRKNSASSASRKRTIFIENGRYEDVVHLKYFNLIKVIVHLGSGKLADHCVCFLESLVVEDGSEQRRVRLLELQFIVLILNN